MKQIIFVRHAKSSWSDMSLRDIDRPLNNRGNRDAPFMGKIMSEKITPDLIMTSPALRAKTTALIFAKQMNYPIDRVVVEPIIYGASLREILWLVQSLDNSFNTVLFFGHNPTFTEVANHFGAMELFNLPTCGIVEVRYDGDDWMKLNNSNAKVVAVDFPKKHNSV